MICHPTTPGAVLASALQRYGSSMLDVLFHKLKVAKSCCVLVRHSSLGLLFLFNIYRHKANLS